MNCYKNYLSKQGKISLIILMILGIFCLNNVNASVTETVSLIATQRTAASFSFDISPLNTRKYVYPNKVSFNTTGNLATTTPVPAYTSDFPAWDSGYPVNNWTRIINNQTSSNFYNYIQISQFPHDFAVSNLRDKFLVCGLQLTTSKITYATCDSPSSFGDIFSSMSTEISDEKSSIKAFATVIAKNRAYCFWTFKPQGANPVIKYCSYSNSWTSPTEISNSSISEKWGVSGCLMKNGNDEYIVIAYPTSDNSISLIAFKDGTNPSSSNITSGISVTNSINGAQITITQNPRTGIVYLGWISGNKAYYKTGTFQPDSNTNFSFSNTENQICSVNFEQAAYTTIYAGSYNNFETSFTISDYDSIRNYCICGEHPLIVQTLPGSGSLAKSRIATAFQYYADGNYYSGSICCSSFKIIDFYSRLLEYPQACSWKSSNKTLHLEGPPVLNTAVTAQVEFAEMVPSDTFARCVNSDFVGGVRNFNSSFNVVGDKAVIASASQCFVAVGFDKAMNTASFPAELASSVSLTESGSTTKIPLTNIASTSGRFVFKPNTDLKLNTNYVITIASDVIDSIGTQIYKNESLNFKTQFSSTPLDADGVIKLEAFSNEACTTQILNGSDIKSNQKLYLRLNAYDPAFNTIDTTTIKVKRNGTVIATLDCIQKEANSNYFYCEYQVSAPINADSNWSFESIKSGISLTLKVTYPILTPSSPASASVGLEPASISSIEISASEELDSSSVNATNVSLWQNSVRVGASISYDSSNKKIVITPNAALSSEKNYLVTVNNISDIAGNKQLVPLAYYFSTRDNTAPTISSVFPANSATNVTIDKKPYIVFSEEILASTVTKSNVVVKCNGSAVDYSLSCSGNKIIIELTNGLKTQSNYQIELKTGITDFSGNNLASNYTYSFRTQPAHTAPTDILSLTLYKEENMFTTFGSSEKVNANTMVYLKLNAVDGATQTLDIATVSISLNNSAVQNLILYETASNSGGLFTGSFNLGSLNLYAFPSTVPAQASNEIKFASTQKNTVTASLRSLFPQITNSSVSATAGNVAVGNAVNVFINTSISLTFSSELDETSITNTSLTLASGSTTISTNKTLSADKKTITIVPSNNLPFASTISLKAPYNANGLKDVTGNPIKGAINLSFKTQGNISPPTSITGIDLYSDSSMSAVYKYADNQDFNKNGIIYIEARGNDAAPNTVDKTTVTLTGGSKVTLTETGANTGVFRGNYQCVNLSDGVFSVTSDVTPAVFKTLQLTTPALTAVFPANNATNVSNAQVVTFTFSEALLTSSINSNNIKLKKKATNTNVTGSISYNESTFEITFRPDNLLEFLKEYEISISNITDLAGNKADSTSISFTIQNSATPPTTVNSIKVYSDTGYTNQLASGTVVSPGSTIAISVDAVDLSTTTTDFINVCIKDTTNNVNKTISLSETDVNTGVFRGTTDIYTDENVNVSFYTEIDNTKSTSLKTDIYPKFMSFNPASGSTDLYLDNNILIDTNKEIDATTVNTSSIILEGTSGNIGYNVSRLTNTQLLITLTDSEAGDNLILTLTNALKDVAGLSFPTTTAEFKLRNKDVQSFKIYKNSDYTSQLTNNSDVEINQELYCEIIGNNLTQNGLTDTMEITFTDGIDSNSVVLNELSEGKFKGSLSVLNSPGKSFKVFPVGFENKAVNFNILEPFALTEYYPASASIGIPADSWPSWTFSRAIPSSQLTNNNFSLYEVSSNKKIKGSLSLSPTKKQVRFMPDSVLELLTTYEMRLSGEVTDANGKKLGTSLKTRFTTQPPPSPPTELVSFANYTDENYISSTTAILSSSNLYLQMVANDPSFSTYEVASVRLDSDDGTYDGVVLTLIETNPPSGIYRLKYPVSLPSGTKITLTPQVDNSFAIILNVKGKPRLTALNPASGSANLYLDTKLEMTFSESINIEDFKNNVTIKKSNGKTITYECIFENTDKKVVLIPNEILDSNNSFSISAKNLKNLEGQIIDPFTYKISTKKESFAFLELYTGLAPCDGKKVSETKEAVRGILGIVASSTDMLQYSEESRILRLSDASHSVDINLNETGLNSNIYVASTTIDNTFTTPIKAKFLFSDQPELDFEIASPTYLLSISPEENEEVPEDTLINAVYSRKIYVKSAENAVKISSEDSETNCKLLTHSDESVELKWKPENNLINGNKHTLSISGLLDYLGQSVSNYSHQFITGGNHGISLYSDATFKNKITTQEISNPNVFVEVIGFNTTGIDENDIFLEIVRGTEASSTQKLKIEPVNGSKKIYRCALQLAAAKSTLPTHKLNLYPGEWVKLSSPLLTSNEVLFYYRFSSGVSPQVINDIRFFSEKKYMRRVTTEISNPSLYIEVDAEDLNWLTQDTTKVKVYSDDDRTGFVIDLLEEGTHSNSYRGMIKISEKATDAANNTLKVSFGKKITVVSETDNSVRASIRYFPRAEIINFTAYPSPAKRNYINFRFFLNFPTGIRISIYDVSGKKLDSFEIDGQEGENTCRWDFPRKMANGVYIYRVKSLATGESYTYAKMVKGKFAVLR